MKQLARGGAESPFAEFLCIESQRLHVHLR